ncbi:MAG: hypothetical protein HY898_09955 [Deltaproteobacteria bacterium]|nr:hypothetical protein [Deltaproteobacteria bacterium]
MTIALGRNSKWTVRPEHRDKIRRMFGEGLGLQWASPAPPVDQYNLGSGTIGVIYEDGALSEQEAQKGAWLELLVDDPERVGAALEAAGVKRIEYQDKTHPYFQVPGGPVFRLAK